MMGGGKEIPLSAFRFCEIEVLSSKALAMSGSLYLTISYLLKDERGGLGI